MRRNVLVAAVLVAVLSFGCSLNATLGARLGHEPSPQADFAAVEKLVCRGDLVGAEGLLTARGFDYGSTIEAIERAKIECEKDAK